MIKSILKFVLLTLGIAVFGLVLGVVDSITHSNSSLGTTGIFGILVFTFSPVLSGLWMWFQKRRNRADQAKSVAEQDRTNFLRHRFLERQRLIDSVDRHRAILIRNIERSIKRNDYGALVSDNRQEALEEFFASIELDITAIEFREAAELVFEQLEIREIEDREAGFDANNLPFDGHAFEKWVAEALVGFGWEASVTSGTGDQGIDVIAVKSDKTIGIQCKLYSSAIGNKAVQEAHAGKVYYNVDVVAVLSNASYTSSAKDLAAVTGVKLLSHHDIPELYEKVFGPPNTASLP
ncbi:MAG: restriction endonuclease [Pseudomonadota bacterium]